MPEIQPATLILSVEALQPDVIRVTIATPDMSTGMYVDVPADVFEAHSTKAIAAARPDLPADGA